MARGLLGHPGAAAVSPVVEEQPPELVPACLVGSHAWDRAKKVKIVKLGNVQVEHSQVIYL